MTPEWGPGKGERGRGNPMRSYNLLWSKAPVAFPPPTYSPPLAGLLFRQATKIENTCAEHAGLVVRVLGCKKMLLLSWSG